ncbi:hypothetical protein [Halopseudomonas maritima]|uniref:hypothetical protein n=1 Tax=Halopseudomonas maritima TaxID=2918528 RepID=UPI001EEC9A9F|nr:hypothetical protein [Halopseudomonas maritima]UJJ30935.1 hypothetical protein HV822_14370 [Halopseudomonas maritima]
MSTIDNTLSNAHAILAGAQDKIDQLRNINPFFIDLSLRENPVGARVGQTLPDQLMALYQRAQRSLAGTQPPT